MSAAGLLPLLLIAPLAAPPAALPSSMPADTVDSLQAVDATIVFGEERERLTREYRAARYGQEGVTSRIAPYGVVVHLTGEETLSTSLARYRAPRIDAVREPRAAARSALGPSVHFVVEEDGTHHRLMPVKKMARHAGPLNTTALGVALVGARSADVTPQQTQAIRDILSADLFATPVPFAIGHHDIERLRGSVFWRDPPGGKTAHPPVPGPRVMAGLTEVKGAADETEVGTDFLYDRTWLNQRSLKELTLLRNAVFARWGRAFPSREWVQAHFDQQPGYQADPDFDAAVLTLLDQENVRLIADVERRLTATELDRRASQTNDRLERSLIEERRKANASLAALYRWKPGRKLAARVVRAVDRDELFAFYVRMSMTLQLAGMYGDCFDAGYQTGVAGVCDAWENGTASRTSLRASDRRALRTVERRLAFFIIEKRYALRDELGLCLQDCAQGPEPLNAVDRKRCRADCRDELAELAADVARDKRADMRQLNNGYHAKGGDLVNQLLYGDLDGFG